jgi:hypothetical protein
VDREAAFYFKPDQNWLTGAGWMVERFPFEMKVADCIIIYENRSAAL